MEFDIRKILVIFVVAILFTLFSYALFDAFYPQVDYEDYCDEKVYQELTNMTSCQDAGGKWEFYNYRPVKEGSNGYCNLDYYCSQDYDEERENRSFYAFIVLSIFGAIAILIGLYLPLTNPINEWIGTGFMLGGLFDVFFGTAMHYEDLGRFLKPAVLFMELALVIFLTYRKLGVSAKPKKKK